MYRFELLMMSGKPLEACIALTVIKSIIQRCILLVMLKDNIEIGNGVAITRPESQYFLCPCLPLHGRVHSAPLASFLVRRSLTPKLNRTVASWYEILPLTMQNVVFIKAITIKL
jgi:hypothetical protein